MIISAPSGGGKDTVIERLVRVVPDSVVYVTATSRKPRPGEIQGTPLVLNTPHVSERETNDGDCTMPDGIRAALGALTREAKLFLDGKREQADMFQDAPAHEQGFGKDVPGQQLALAQAAERRRTHGGGVRLEV